MEIKEIKLADIKPYENNPRFNDEAVDAVAESIQQFGFKVPIVIDKNGVIVTGHTRYKAAKAMSMDKVPCILADDLTDKQIKAYRLADNKVAEIAKWDLGKLEKELAEISNIDMDSLGFKELEREQNEWFNRQNRSDDSREEGNDEYNEFLDKFEVKKTTDDCYTPDGVYNAVAEWVAKEYKADKKRFVRPFYPGGGTTGTKNISSEILSWTILHSQY